MSRVEEAMLLYAVTDRMWTGEKSLYEQVEEALKGGVTCVQIREKELSCEEFLKEAVELKALCDKYGVMFIVNDNVDIAIKCGAEGIHVGQDDMKAEDVRKLVGNGKILGVSASSVAEAIEAEKNGADYIGVGAMFPTATKKDADSVSYETLKEICSTVKIPVVAIGGITKENMSQLKGSGVEGVALVSAIFAAKDIEKECKELKEIVKEVL